jgi:excisionase family DNA binding protein
VHASQLKSISIQHKPLLSIEEAAEVLGISRSSLYRSIQRGDLPLPLFRINGRYRVARRAVEALVDGAEPRGRPAPDQLAVVPLRDGTGRPA